MIAYDGKYALDDIYLRKRIKQIIKEHKIKVVIETGLAEGNSTLEFCRMLVPQVIGIELDPESYMMTSNLLNDRGWRNFRLFRGNSPEVLQALFREDFVPVDNMLLFLDAHIHNGDTCLLEEINVIPRGKGILVFHDIQVPGKDFGFDNYIVNGQLKMFDYAMIKDALMAWSPTHRLEYNSEASGSYRGVAIVYQS